MQLKNKLQLNQCKNTKTVTDCFTPITNKPIQPSSYLTSQITTAPSPKTHLTEL